MAIDHDTPARPAAGRVRGLGHIVLYVADLDRSLVFYRDVLGWPLLPAPSGPHGFAGFRAGETHHDLMLIEVGRAAAPIPTGRRLGLYHFGVKVGDSDDDLRAVLARLDAHPGLGSVLGAVDATVFHSLYVTDPDGNEVELYVDLPGFDLSDPLLLAGTGRRPLSL
ncbi:VOC family protein [Streptomyces lunaelactis]|uniref:VOC family protein n=1 Tax=Streptomyces lunaelactis TaxID=1535768 RepID=UPI0015847562|nr:VOC family protein [Streptomyces lunaelactis]NUK25607.1 VOC family protein [Streptomyces lunaelactis]NUK53248.1 VOC family protein [Streptomyces lunaelactis]NUK64905.1 VOC family protein [Streptomyces lunaelactis]